MNQQTLPAEQVIYLTNSIGDDTGNGSLILNEEDFDLVSFADAPGMLRCYLVQCQGQKMVLGNLEIPFRHDFWCDEEDLAALPSEAQAQAVGNEIYNEVMKRVQDPARGIALHKDEGRFVIGVAIPLSCLNSAEQGSKILKDAFAERCEYGRFVIGDAFQATTAPATDQSEVKQDKPSPPIAIVHAVCRDFDGNGITSVGAVAALRAMTPHWESHLKEGWNPRVMSDDIDELRALLEVMRAEVMTRLTTQPATNEVSRGLGPVPESASECEFGDMEYQWRLSQAGF